VVRQDRKGETRQEQNGVLVMCQTEVLNAIEWDEVVTTKIIGAAGEILKVVIYKTPECPKCRELAARLTQRGVEFEERDMTQPAVLAELRCDGVFCLSAPILKVDDEYYEDGEWI